MNILFICDEYPPGKNGGIGSMTRTLARGMAAAGHQVFVAGLYTPGYGQKDYEEDEGVRVWRRRFGLDIGLIRNNYSLTDTLMLLTLRKSGLLRLDATRSAQRFHSFILELIEKFRIDIVEWPDFNEYFKYLPSAFTWPSLPVPLVIKFHGTASWFHRQMQEKADPRVFVLEKMHIGRGDALVAVSRDTADGYISFYGINKEISVLYNSIEIPDPAGIRGSRSVDDRSGQTIVFSGALTRRKGIYSLMEAWNIVHRNDPTAILRVFGKGKKGVLLARLEASASDSVRFEGFVTRDKLYPALSTAAAAIFPSYAECFAIAPLEAMAFGCPVIYTRRASGPELIREGVNGLLVDPDDYRGIADAMMLLLANEGLRKTFSQNGRQTVEQRFGIGKSVADHLSFYERVIAGI